MNEGWLELESDPGKSIFLGENCRFSALRALTTGYLWILLPAGDWHKLHTEKNLVSIVLSADTGISF